VGHQVERVVERRDCCDDADGEAIVEALLVYAVGKGIERQRLAADPTGFLGGDGDGVDAAADLAARLADRFGTLRGDRAGELLVALFDQPRGLEEDGYPLV